MRKSQGNDASGDLRLLYGDKVPALDPVDIEPELYYHYPFDVVRLGWQLWKQNNFAYPIPDPEILFDVDPHWLDDLQRYHQGVEFQKEVVKRELHKPSMPVFRG